MAHVGVSITKTCVFRDSVQEFSNVYHFTWTGLNPGQSLATDLIDRLVTLEKPLHGSAVTFKYARCWSAGGTPSANNMIAQKTLTGTGTSTLSTANDAERAYLIRWRAGNDSRGRPVYLRKWYHLQAQISGASITAAITNQTTGWTSAERSTIANKFNDFNPVVFNGGLTTGRLVSANGREGDTNAEAHKYLEHHQLGDQWRG
jgi:hypothetical protein